MKITDIQIERYGVWQHLALPLRSAGLNVFYGPNEAGKTTLLHFLRDVLYGQSGLSWENPNQRGVGPNWNGAVRLTHEDRYCEVHRWSVADQPGGMEFQELDPALAWNMEPEWAVAESSDFDATMQDGRPAEETLQEILAQTHAKLFRHVFAIGLNELQELATLHDEEVAQHIYGLSLGLEGRKLLEVSGQFEPGQTAWSAVPSLKKRLTQLMNQDAELQTELQKYDGQRERHQHLVTQQLELDEKIQRLQQKQEDLKRQLRGHETLHQAWEPWNQVREYEAQLRTLPQAALVSQIDPAKLSRLENEIRELTRQRKTVIAETRQLRKQIEAAGKEAADRELAAEMQGFLNQRSWVVQIEREAELASARARELKTEFEARQQALGKDWPVQRLTSIDTSHAAYTRLVDVARTYQSSQTRQAALRKRYDKHAAACHQRQAELDQQVERLPENTLDEALDLTRQQLIQVEELARLHLREDELTQRIANQKRELSRLQDRSQVPHWVPGFLLFLAMSGLILSALGFYTGLTSNGITGAILGLVGVAGFAIARAFQLHAQGNVEEEFSSVQTAIRNQENTLSEIRKSIKRHTPARWVVTITEAELVKDRAETVITTKLSSRLSDLKQIENRQKRLQSRRRRLSRMRKAMQTRQRDVSQARQAWCDGLKQCGLDETAQVEEAFELWQKISETMEQMRAWDAARETASEVQQRHEGFCHRLADFGQRTGHTRLDYNKPLAVLDVWQQELAGLGKESQEQLSHKRELRNRKREAERLKQQILASRASRTAMLAQVGATNREEFEQRLNSANRRGELEELLEMARLELTSFSQENRDLAIVEEDLRGYSARQTRESIDLMKMELDDQQTQLTQAFENLGRIKQELAALESDRRPAALRFEREAVAGQLRECLEQHAAIGLGRHTVEQLREQFERSCQPEILALASEYLAQLTCGKYTKVWTTLAEQKLRVTDHDEQTLFVEQLSNGTREQLFLALRLGLVHEFANRGIELPMVLDDVLVNFDQSRTEAAIQTLIEFAERGHQVLLFTSHLHLARLCESQGIDPVWLPAHHALVEQRRAG